MEKDREKLVLTFEDLLQTNPISRTGCADSCTSLETAYEYPVDLEFTLDIEQWTKQEV